MRLFSAPVHVSSRTRAVEGFKPRTSVRATRSRENSFAQKHIRMAHKEAALEMSVYVLPRCGRPCHRRPETLLGSHMLRLPRVLLFCLPLLSPLPALADSAAATQ